MVVADHLCTVLELLGYEATVPAINYSEGVAMLESERPDLAMLDIQLAGSKDGIDLAWKIREEYDIPFIFLTSNADPRTIDRVKRLNPPAFLVKPFNRDDLYASIELALHNYSSKAQKEIPEREEGVEENYFIKDAIFFKNKNRFDKVRIGDIKFLKAEHVYVEVYTQDGKKYLVRNSLTNLTSKLPSNFFRTHRSYTINLDCLESINYVYVLIGEHEIPIGKNYREQLMTKIRIE